MHRDEKIALKQVVLRKNWWDVKSGKITCSAICRGFLHQNATGCTKRVISSLSANNWSSALCAGLFSYKAVGSPAPVRPCTEKARKAAGLWASICLVPPRRAGEEGCGARSAANPDNIPFFEFRSQADLCMRFSQVATRLYVNKLHANLKCR